MRTTGVRRISKELEDEIKKIQEENKIEFTKASREAAKLLKVIKGKNKFRIEF